MIVIELVWLISFSLCLDLSKSNFPLAAEQIAVEVERDEGERFRSSLFRVLAGNEREKGKKGLLALAS